MPPCAASQAFDSAASNSSLARGSSQSGWTLQVLLVALHDQEQLGPFGQVARLVAPGTEDIRLVLAVVVGIDRPVAAIVFPYQIAVQASLAHRDVVGQGLGARQEAPVAGRLEGGQQRFAGVHVRVLAAVAVEVRPVGAGFVGVQAVGRFPEAPLPSGPRSRRSRRALPRGRPSAHAHRPAARRRGRSSDWCASRMRFSPCFQSSIQA
jgi:hypothetical protein